MKILLVTGSLNQGGAEFQLLALADLLQRRGFEIEVLALTDYSYYLSYIKEKKLRYSCIASTGNKFRRIFRAVKKIRSARPDLVISYLRVTSLVAMLAKVLAFSRFKLIISERTALILPKFDILYFNLARSANALTVNAVSKLNYINQRFPALKKHTFFIPNIIDIDKFRRVEKQISVNDEVRIVYTGRISPEKNLLNLVKAMDYVIKKGYRASLSLYGSASNRKYFKEIDQLIKELNLENKVQYKGSKTDIREVYKKADLLCLVSIFEGFSNVLSEALCCGLPVVASDLEENHFLIQENENGFFVKPGDPAGIAEGIEKFLLLTPAQKNILSENNRRKAEAVFVEDTIFQSYLSVFKNIGAIA